MWTAEEEQAVAALMAAGGLKRPAAIRLFRRMKGDLKKALKHASESQVRKEVARQRFKGQLQGQNPPLANDRPIDAPSPRSDQSLDIPKRGAR
jgi:hypothetical protein